MKTLARSLGGKWVTSNLVNKTRWTRVTSLVQEILHFNILNWCNILTLKVGDCFIKNTLRKLVLNNWIHRAKFTLLPIVFLSQNIVIVHIIYSLYIIQYTTASTNCTDFEYCSTLQQSCLCLNALSVNTASILQSVSCIQMLNLWTTCILFLIITNTLFISYNQW